MRKFFLVNWGRDGEDAIKGIEQTYLCLHIADIKIWNSIKFKGMTQICFNVERLAKNSDEEDGLRFQSV